MFPRMLAPWEAVGEQFTAVGSRTYFCLVVCICMVANGDFIYTNQEQII